MTARATKDADAAVVPRHLIGATLCAIQRFLRSRSVVGPYGLSTNARRDWAMLDAVMMTDRSLGSLARPTRSKPATRTGWWLPITALVAWLCYRQVDAVTATSVAFVGAGLFIAVFGVSVLRATAHRWWGGTTYTARRSR